MDHSTGVGQASKLPLAPHGESFEAGVSRSPWTNTATCTFPGDGEVHRRHERVRIIPDGPGGEDDAIAPVAGSRVRQVFGSFMADLETPPRIVAECSDHETTLEVPRHGVGAASASEKAMSAHSREGIDSHLRSAVGRPRYGVDREVVPPSRAHRTTCGDRRPSRSSVRRTGPTPRPPAVGRSVRSMPATRPPTPPRAPATADTRAGRAGTVPPR